VVRSGIGFKLRCARSLINSAQGRRWMLQRTRADAASAAVAAFPGAGPEARFPGRISSARELVGREVSQNSCPISGSVRVNPPVIVRRCDLSLLRLLR